MVCAQQSDRSGTETCCAKGTRGFQYVSEAKVIADIHGFMKHLPYCIAVILASSSVHLFKQFVGDLGYWANAGIPGGLTGSSRVY
jgi:hypothetical protein